MSFEPNLSRYLRHLRVERRLSPHTLKAYERINNIALLPEALDAANGMLTQSLKPRRHVIVEHFADRITEAYQ